MSMHSLSVENKKDTINNLVKRRTLCRVKKRTFEISNTVTTLDMNLPTWLFLTK